MKCYIEVKRSTIEIIPMETVMCDCVEFFKMFGFYEISHDKDLACGPAVDETNEIIIKLEHLAMKYGLYNEEEACSDPWYHEYNLFPKMIEFFKENCFKQL